MGSSVNAASQWALQFLFNDTRCENHCFQERRRQLKAAALAERERKLWLIMGASHDQDAWLDTFEEQTKAALVIQTVARVLLARRTAARRAEEARHLAAVVLVQGRIRRFQAKARAAAARQQPYAATRRRAAFGGLLHDTPTAVVWVEVGCAVD